MSFSWELGNQPAAKVREIIAEQGYQWELRLNGVTWKKGGVPLGANQYAHVFDQNHRDHPYWCGEAKTTCIAVSPKWNHAWGSATPPWTVEFSYWKTGAPVGKKTKMIEVIHPNQTTGQSYFAHKFSPIFTHARCTACHALGSKDALVNRHKGTLPVGMIRDVPGKIGMNLGCGGGCHVEISRQPVAGVEFHDTEWKTPRFDMGIDWRGKSDQYICQKVTSSLPTAAMKREHFYQDTRIAWAVHSGALPLGRGKLATAPPGDYWKFMEIVDWWIRSGAPCPK